MITETLPNQLESLKHGIEVAREELRSINLQLNRIAYDPKCSPEIAYSLFSVMDRLRKLA